MKLSILSIFIALTITSASFGREPNLLQTFKDDDQLVFIQFSPDSKTLASTAWGDIRLWDVNTGKRIGILDILNTGYDYCLSLAFSPDGKILAGGSYSKIIILWDISNQKEIAKIRTNDGTNVGIYGRFPAVAFNPDGKTILAWNCDSHGEDQSIKTWDVASHKNIGKVKLPGKYLEMRFNPDGKTIAGLVYSENQRETIELIDTATGKKITGLDGGDGVNEMAFCPDGRIFAAAIDFSTIHKPKPREDLDLPDVVKLWDAKTGNNISTIKEPMYTIVALAFSPDGKIIATGTQQNSIIKIWDVSTGKHITSLKNPKHDREGVWSISFSPDGKLLASGRGDGTIDIWDVQGIGKNGNDK
jgi:WD40 repeat protein